MTSSVLGGEILFAIRAGASLGSGPVVLTCICPALSSLSQQTMGAGSV